MQSEFDHLDKHERLRAENEFLKMKLMLEKGAIFGGMKSEDIPPEIERVFLDNIFEIERQLENMTYTSLFKKIGSPDSFGPIDDIIPEDIQNAWQKLSRHLFEHEITLRVSDPNVSARELYRFTTEELFPLEVEELDIDGREMEFDYCLWYSNPLDNESPIVKYNLLFDIFDKRDLGSEKYYSSNGFIFNSVKFENFQDFFPVIHRFKSLFEKIELKEFTVTNCKERDRQCTVHGTYTAEAGAENESSLFSGKVEVRLAMEEEYWRFKEITIEGFNP